MQGIKAESFPNCDFIPVEFPEVRHVKVSFKKLLRACVPSAPVADPDQMFLRAVENSEWLNQVIIFTSFSYFSDSLIFLLMVNVEIVSLFIY